jgi:hypothetical protein
MPTPEELAAAKAAEERIARDQEFAAARAAEDRILAGRDASTFSPETFGELYDSAFDAASAAERGEKQAVSVIVDTDAFELPADDFDDQWKEFGRPKRDGHPIPSTAMTGASGWRKNVKDSALIAAMKTPKGE